ncbi:unnamed protein product [Nesidiocoris tenuis]|uniref:Malate dehydrogenase, mitochondrial n=1 Tax=Nesidiocoris tenuis TaxID=355587 RepID=A0A6H5H1N8_9HEMI|nr:unnamed protein product [Nesidiocoris tenuis]
MDNYGGNYLREDNALNTNGSLRRICIKNVNFGPIFQSRSASFEPCDECPKEKEDEPFYKPPTSVKVAVLNSVSTVGRITNLLLKQDPLIRELRIYCKGNTAGLAADLRALPTSAKAFHFTGANLHSALKNADIVLCVGAAEADEENTDEDVFNANKNYIQKVARVAAKTCPEAVVGISVYPINSTVPLFAEIMRQHGVFCPNKILGVPSLYTMRARSVTACMLGVNPSTVTVNVLGGGTPNTIVPLITSANPAGHCLAVSYKLWRL